MSVEAEDYFDKSYIFGNNFNITIHILFIKQSIWEITMCQNSEVEQLNIKTS